MREKTLHLIAVLCYVCGAVFFGYTAYVCTYDALSMRGIVLLSTLVFLSFLLGTFLRCRVETAHTQKRRFVHLFLFICFLLYGIILCNQLFLIRATDGFLMENSFIPTRTLWQYFQAYQNGAADLSALLSFVLHNAVLFAPLGFFLPCLFRPMQKGSLFFLALFLTVLGFEALLFFTMSQALNADCVLLRILGASIVYLLCKVRFIQSLMHRSNMQRRRR